MRCSCACPSVAGAADPRCFKHACRACDLRRARSARHLDALPRVDLTYAYAGCDGTAVRAFIAAGAKGIVSAGFAPGFTAPDEAVALREAVEAGIVVVQSTRAGSGRTFRSKALREAGFLIADNLNPQKARILLALALSVTNDPDEITRIFKTY